VERTKPPVLTSPWKIGFFVSLMLVFVGIGVAYFFSRTMGTAWSWPQLSEWQVIVNNVMHGEGVFVEVWPIYVLVGASSLISYLVITQGVRKYKRYLDSGHDYKQLLSTIHQIEDLNDTDRIGELRNHPELREFLHRIRHEHEDRAQMMDEREKALESSVMATEKKKEEEITSDLNDQCGRLIEAVVRSHGTSFPKNIDITLPELKRVEDAIRNTLSRQASADLGTIDVPQQTVDVEGLWKELDETSRVARDLEKEVSGLTSSESINSGDADMAKRDLDGLMASCDALGKLSNSLDTLSEDSRSVAINTALQAGSGQSTQNDLVKLAEDVKEMAAQYGELAKTLGRDVVSVQRAVDRINASLPTTADGASSKPMLTSVANRISLLNERLMVVADKYRPAGEYGDIPHASKADSDDFRVESYGTAEPGHSIFSHSGDEGSDIPGLQRNDHLDIDQDSADVAAFNKPQPTDHEFEEMPQQSARPTPPKPPVLDTEPAAPTAAHPDADPLEVEPMPAAPRFDASALDAEPAPGASRFDVDPLDPEPAPGASQFDADPLDAEPAGEDAMFAELSDQQPALPNDRMRMRKDLDPPSRLDKTTPKQRDESDSGGIDASGLELDTGYASPAGSPQVQTMTDTETKRAQEEDEAMDLYDLGAVDFDPVLHG
jgi:hypothetical protein